MASSRCLGSRSEMVLVVGFRLGRTTCWAFAQSTWSELLWVSQNVRSSASEAKAGTDLRRLVIDASLLPVHVARGNHPDSRPAHGKRDVQLSPHVGRPQGVKARLGPTVFRVFQHQQRLIEKHLLRFRCGHAMFVVLAGVAFVPLEAFNQRQVDHGCILWTYTRQIKKPLEGVLY